MLIGESPSLGRKRAIFDVMSGSGADLERTLRRLEKEDTAHLEREDAVGRTLLCCKGCHDCADCT